jgi:hypothetical protein
MRARYLPWLLPLAVGCSSAENPAATDGSGLSTSTGLEGVVRRGPILPVCSPDEACEAPFAARFEVRSGERPVAQFRSDSAGHFFVRLAPGEYTVVPDSSAPLLGVMWQTHAVVVGSAGISHVELDFDTGIR